MGIKIKIAEAAHDEHGSGYYGYEANVKPGDQLGTSNHYNEEVRWNNWYNKPWVHIYRAKDERIANEIAIRAEECVANNHIGYSQPGRSGLADYLISVNPSPAQLTYDVNCDCSSMVNSIVYVTLRGFGITPKINGYEVTSTMASKYAQMSDVFDDVISKTDLSNGHGVKRGDILLGAPATHTAIVCYVEDDTPKPKEYNKIPQYVGQVYNCGMLNVRTGPGANYPNYSKWPQLSEGNLVDVCDNEGNWLYVRIAGTHYAWVSKTYITSNIKTNAAREGKVTAISLCLREQPVDGKVLKYMPLGATVTILSQLVAKNGIVWYEANYKGTKGYCSSKYIK